MFNQDAKQMKRDYTLYTNSRAQGAICTATAIVLTEIQHASLLTRETHAHCAALELRLAPGSRMTRPMQSRSLVRHLYVEGFEMSRKRVTVRCGILYALGKSWKTASLGVRSWL
jgi:hypothetical protein